MSQDKGGTQPKDEMLNDRQFNINIHFLAGKQLDWWKDESQIQIKLTCHFVMSKLFSRTVTLKYQDDEEVSKSDAEVSSLIA